jgi:DNA repair protein RecN (Recombination protein N)
MLKSIRIQNFAIIDEVAIEFGPGLNIISGETGAGKSILMDALALILGGRASSDLIRAGADEATVEALFEIPSGSPLLETLASLGLEANDGDLILRRIVQRSGKNRIFVNGHMANMATLQSVTGSLVDLCSQHDQQLLSRPEEQLFWIDRFGGLEDSREAVTHLHSAWREKVRSLEDLNTDSAQRAQRIDFLRFQLQELEEAAIPSPTEDAEIEAELKVLGNAENLFAFAADADAALLSGAAEQPSLLDSVAVLLTRGKTLAAADPELGGAVEHLEALKLHGDELGHFLRGYSQRLSRDEGRLEALNARHALLAKLRRKYGPTLADVLAHQTSLAAELARLENHDSSLAGARAEVEAAYEALCSAGRKLSSARAKKAREFSQAVVRELGGLHMDRARFEAVLQPLGEPNAHGFESARFEIAANPGEPMGPLNKVASGGELSRVMLAMHNVVSSKSSVGVFLFDEVDSGIGGAVAVAVGAKLRRVASHNQVVCITHLPQVACYGQSHFRVEKTVAKKGREERTVCRVDRLSPGERELELARMLGGLGNPEAALANARAMLKTAEDDAKPVKLVPPVAKGEKKARPVSAARRG